MASDARGAVITDSGHNIALENPGALAHAYLDFFAVAHHLRQAFRKLSIASRVGLARTVIEHRRPGGRLTWTHPAG